MWSPPFVRDLKMPEWAGGAWLWDMSLPTTAWPCASGPIGDVPDNGLAWGLQWLGFGREDHVALGASAAGLTTGRGHARGTLGL